MKSPASLIPMKNNLKTALGISWRIDLKSGVPGFETGALGITSGLKSAMNR